MFEMFVLLINEINPHSFCFVSYLTQRIVPHDLLYCIFENLPWEFDVAIYRGNLPQEFAAAICRGFFVYISESFFVYVSKSCLYGGKPFFICVQNFLICEIFFINSASSCYCRGSYGPPYLLSLAHTPNCYKILKVITITTS